MSEQTPAVNEHFVEFLFAAWQQHADLSDEETNVGQAFVDFAAEYLRKNPPNRVGYAGTNYEITLSDNSRFLIAPMDGSEHEPGTMEPSSYVTVSGKEAGQMQQHEEKN